MEQTLQHIAESLAKTATVKSVFGDPISSEGKTVVPVARVAYGFGAAAALAGQDTEKERKTAGNGRRVVEEPGA